ncbi:MAG: hypothetical protein WD877_00615 [Candidatus Saccharimonadales bacterium]
MSLVNSERNKNSHNRFRNTAALGFSALALAVSGESAGSAAQPRLDLEAPAAVEQVPNPKEIARRLLEDINYNPESLHPNVVYTGALVLKSGTFLNSGPVAAAEHLKKPLAGTGRVKAGESYLIQFPRLVYYDNTQWAIGFRSPPAKAPASAIRVGAMRWINLKTARYDALGYPDLKNPRAFAKPKLVPVYADPEYDLRLVQPVDNIHPHVVPPILQLMTRFETQQALEAQLDYSGLREIPARFNPHIGKPRRP